MSKYKVKIVSEVTKVAYVEVEAENEDDAYDQGCECEEKDLNWEVTYSQYYVDDTEAIKPSE